MHLFIFFFTALLFFVLTPGIIISIPYKASKNVVAITHATVFALLWSFSHKMVWDWGINMGWILTNKEAMTLRQCKNKGGRYDAGDCYDDNNKVIDSETSVPGPAAPSEDDSE